MAYWLIKSDPDVRSFDDLADEGWQGTEWSGVREDEAFDHFTRMMPGDLAFFYHTGYEHRFFGILKIISAAHPDSTDDSGQWLAVDVAVFLRLIAQIPFSTVKLDPDLADFAEQMENGPSVQPVSYEQWARVCELSDMPKIPRSG